MKIINKKYLLNSCPHCKINKPNLEEIYSKTFRDFNNQETKTWYVFVCNNCYGLIAVETALNNPNVIIKHFPSEEIISEKFYMIR